MRAAEWRPYVRWMWDLGIADSAVAENMGPGSYWIHFPYLFRQPCGLPPSPEGKAFWGNVIKLATLFGGKPL